jgi:O-antigen/teichoic acid export membrane protein
VQFIVKVVAIAMMIGLLYLWERSARAIVTSNVLAELSTFAIVIILIARRGLLRVSAYDSEYARKIIAFAAPLVIFEMSSAVLDGGDRLLIKSMLGSAAVGLYSAAYNVSVYVQDLVFASVNQALVPLWIRIWKTEGPEATAAFLSRALNDFVVACCLLCCGTFVCSGDLLLMLAGSQYREARPLVPIIVVGLVIYTFTTFFNAGLYLNKRTGVMAGIVFTSATTNLALNYIFLPKFGIIAAVYATIVSYTLAMVITAILSSRYLEVRVEYASILKAIAVAAVVAYALSPLDFGRPIVNILVKGLLSVIGFVVLLGLINAPLRARAFAAVRQVRA